MYIKVLIIMLFTSLSFAQSNPCGLTESQIILDGNSLILGRCSAGAEDTIRVKLARMLGTNYTIINKGVGGISMIEMLNALPDAIFPLYTRNKILYNLYFEGANAISDGYDVDSICQHYLRYGSYSKQRGYITGVHTILPFTVGSNDSLNNAKRIYINEWIRTNWDMFSDLLIDIAQDTIIGQWGDHLNTTYYCDGIHLNGNGNEIFARWDSLAIKTYEANN